MKSGKSIDFDLIGFDWSGVISDDRRPVYMANMELLRIFGKPVTSFEEWWSRVQASAHEFLKDRGVFIEQKEAQRLYAAAFNHVVSSGVRPSVYPDAREVLEYIAKKGKSIAILSTHPGTSILREAEEYDLVDHISRIRGDAKDKAEGLRELCSYFGAKPSRTLFIGDMTHDVAAGKRASVVSAGITTGYHTREKLQEANPDLLLSSLSELKTLI